MVYAFDAVYDYLKEHCQLRFWRIFLKLNKVLVEKISMVLMNH